MISAMTSSATDDVTVVFLDANILAKPVTRTILMVGGMPSGFQPVWSLAAETEAARHMRPRALSPTLVRERFGLPLAPTGLTAERYLGTRTADRQILADAVAADADFLVTEDVDDYGLADLTRAGVAAVNPDLFLAVRLTRDAYEMAIALFVERQVRPPTTPAQFHAAIARQHPRLFAAHANLYAIEPDDRIHQEPAVVFRGGRCLRCEVIADPATILDGLGRSVVDRRHADAVVIARRRPAASRAANSSTARMSSCTISS